MLMVPFLKGYASELKDSASFGVDTYSDSNDVQVYSPTLSYMKMLSKHWLVGIKMRVDAIAAASIRIGGSPARQVDAVATASKKSGFDDVRATPTFIVAYDDGEQSASAGIYYSSEEDYISKAIFANYTKQLNKGNTAIGIGFSQSADNWSPANNRVLSIDNRDEQKIDFSINQLLSPTASIQFVYSYMHSKGFLASPYPYVMQDSFIGFEQYPEDRVGHAFALKGVQYIDENNALNYGYRYYTDDWGIDSHTFNAEWLHDINDELMVGARARYYTQSAADFTKAIGTYTTNDKYLVADYRMSAFESYDIGLPIKYKTSADSPYTFSISLDYYWTSDNAYIKAWHGEDNIRAIYTTFRIDYEF
jgi:hypothetical protein